MLPHIERCLTVYFLVPTAITLSHLTERDTAEFAYVRSMEELGVIFAGVVAAAWLTPI